MQANRQIVKSPLKRRSWSTIVIILIFLLGRNIPLPLVDASKSVIGGQNKALLNVASLISGGDFSQISVFSLGLGPWMSTMIIWGFLSSSKKLNLKKMSTKVADRWRKILMIIIGTIQTLGLISFMDFKNLLHTENRAIYVAIVAFLMLSGCFIIMWLANLNTKYGIGNSSMIILVGLVASLPNRLYKSIYNDNLISFHIWVYWVIGFLCLLTLFCTILLERAEYRIPLERVMIHNDFASKSYIPIKLNVAGGMAIMYGMTLLVLPQYLFSGLKMLMPNNPWLDFLISDLQLSKPLGLSVYLVILFLLTMGFAVVNVKPDEVTERLQEMGDYIHGIAPGRSTFKFLNKKVRQIGFIGGLYTIIIIGIPLVLGYFNDLDSTISTLPGTILILATLVFSIYDQVQMLKLNKQYQELL